VVASVASVVVARSILGNEPLFRVPEYHLQHPAELLAYAVLGIVGGTVSVLFCRGLLGLRRGFQLLPPRTRVVQPALGALFIGALLTVMPQVMGVGYEYVDQALNGGLLLRTMVLLCLLKMTATVVSYASGNAGGIFAPSLYIGAMAGGALGMIVHDVAPFPTADPGAYALVGMGTLFAGIIRAPMTSVFMIFELTQDYQILVPLMVANLLSFLISRRFQPIPVYHALLRQDQVHLPSPATRSPSALWTAADVMTTDVEFVSASESVRQVWDRGRADGAGLYLVGSAEQLIGVVSAERLTKAIESGRETEAITGVVEQTFVHAHPDHPSDVVLDRLAQSGGLLPVVSRANTQLLLGIVTLAHVVRFIRRRAASPDHESNSNKETFSRKRPFE
jgi:CIC family chloride channel protein